MTDFDRKLIEKAKKFSHWDFRNVDVLIAIADTETARQQLIETKWEHYDLVEDTL